MVFEPGVNDENPILHLSIKVDEVIEQAFPSIMASSFDINDAAGFDGPTKKFGGSLTKIASPMATDVRVVNKTCVNPVVVRRAKLSPDSKINKIFEICPPIAGEKKPIAKPTSALVATVNPLETASLGTPVVSCPAAKVMD
jgi:hypothetical protein